MADKPFRVLLDVTDLHLEDYKYVWINVSPRELKTISDLKGYILHRIKLNRDVQLFVQDGLLLEEENTVILREDDTIKIKYKISACQNFMKESLKKNANFSRKRNHSESSVSDNDNNSKRYRAEDITLSSNVSNIEKESKKEKRKKTKSANSEKFCTAEELKNGQEDLFMNSANMNSASIENKKKRKKVTGNCENFSSTSVDKEKSQSEVFINIENCLVEENQSSKKSHKKNKNKSYTIGNEESVTDINFCQTNESFYSLNAECTPEKQIKSNTTSSKTGLSESEMASVIVLHNDSLSIGDESVIPQNESPEIVTTNVNSEELSSKNQPKKKRKRRRKRKRVVEASERDICDLVSNLESLSENVDKNINRRHTHYSISDESDGSDSLKGATEYHNPETFVLNEDKVVHTQSSDYPKMSTPAQSNKPSIPDLQLSIMPNKNSNLSYNENDSVLNGKSALKSTTSKNNTENKSVKQTYEDLPDITSLPDVGTCIAYKALELDENYSPVVTDYREGVIERIIPDTGELEIRLHKELILPGKSGKFENLKEDEVAQPIIKTYDVLKWCDIILPKALS